MLNSLHKMLYQKSCPTSLYKNKLLINHFKRNAKYTHKINIHYNDSIFYI